MTRGKHVGESEYRGKQVFLAIFGLLRIKQIGFYFLQFFDRSIGKGDRVRSVASVRVVKN